MKKSLWIAALAALIDRAAKLAWAAADFVLIPGVLGVRGTRNTGMAFGMLGGQPYLLAVLTAGVMIALFVYLRKKRLPGYAWAGFGLILGGAAGNLFDRLTYGYVIDMLEPLFARLFVFNPADAAVVCGAVLLGVYLLFGKEDTPDERA